MPPADGCRSGARGLPARWLDVSRPLTDRVPVWPGDEPLRRREQVEHGVVTSTLTTTVHVGTHLDAPRHVDPAAAAVDGVPLQRLIGPAEVVAVRRGPSLVTPESFPADWSPCAPRLLLRTDSHPPDAVIAGGYSAIDPTTVGWLAGLGVRLIGVDTPSVDPFESQDLAAHRALVRHGMTWLEGLLLADVDPGTYFLVALPLPLVGADAAPVRAVLGAWE